LADEVVGHLTASTPSGSSGGIVRYPFGIGKWKVFGVGGVVVSRGDVRGGISVGVTTKPIQLWRIEDHPKGRASSPTN
jgi:hypothetical protein